jgi:hypothetical protein
MTRTCDLPVRSQRSNSLTVYFSTTLSPFAWCHHTHLAQKWRGKWPVAAIGRSSGPNTSTRYVKTKINSYGPRAVDRDRGGGEGRIRDRSTRAARPAASHQRIDPARGVAFCRKLWARMANPCRAARSRKRTAWNLSIGHVGNLLDPGCHKTLYAWASFGPTCSAGPSVT